MFLNNTKCTWRRSYSDISFLGASSTKRIGSVEIPNQYIVIAKHLHAHGDGAMITVVIFFAILTGGKFNPSGEECFRPTTIYLPIRNECVTRT